MNDEQLVLAPLPDVSEDAIKSVTDLLRREDTVRAKTIANQLVRQFRQCAACQYLNYQVAIADKDYAAAGNYLAAALALQPEHPLLLLSHAQLTLNSYRYAATAEYIAKVAGLYRGNNITFLSAVAKVMMQIEQPALAVPVYQRILAIDPANVQVMHQLAQCYFFLNKPCDAAELLNTVITKAPANAGAIHLRSALQTYTQQHNHIDQLQQLISTTSQHPAIYYALAKELEDVADYDKSFLVLKQGAALMRKSISYNEVAELTAITGIITATSGMTIPPPTELARGPIFIVGMPRTGTTLVERILAQHDSVHPIGEFSLFPQLLASMANEYLRQPSSSVSTLHDAALKINFSELGRRYQAAANELSAGNPNTIDKLPVNFLYCGFIKKALPNARIIHLSRNAMDSCYAIYKTLFINAYSFSYDLDELANYYVTYKKIMKHWHDIMPGQILDIQYEDLVTNSVDTAQRLAQWCDMTFKPELLDFYTTDAVSTTASAAQVRKPIYNTSVGKWRNMASELEVLRNKLRRAGVEG